LKVFLKGGIVIAPCRKNSNLDGYMRKNKKILLNYIRYFNAFFHFDVFLPLSVRRKSSKKWVRYFQQLLNRRYRKNPTDVHTPGWGLVAEEKPTMARRKGSDTGQPRKR